MPGMVVEVALGPSAPWARVEQGALDEVSSVAARLLPASGQGQEG